MDTVDSEAEEIISEDIILITVVAARIIEGVVLVVDKPAWWEPVANPVVLEESDVAKGVVDAEGLREASLERDA